MKSNSRVLALALALPILAGTALFFLLSECPAESVAVLPFKPQVRRPLPPWTATPRLWLSRLKDAVLGPGKSFFVSSFVVDFKDRLAIPDAGLPAPQFSNTDVRVWIVSAEQMTELRSRIRETTRTHLLETANLSTADRRQAEVSVTRAVPVNGTNQNVAVTLYYLPRARRDSTDLSSTLFVTEAITNPPAGPGNARNATVMIRTNLALALRVQIPNRHGVFLIGPDHGASDGRAIGAIISPTMLQPRQ